MVSVKVLVPEKLSPEGLSLLKATAHVDERLGLSPDEVLALIPDYDALIVRSETKVTSSLLAAGKNLKVVARAGVGVDNDLEAATRLGIIVVNSPSGNIEAAAEHTIALILSVARNVPDGCASLKAGKWERSRLVGVEVKGKTLGVIGFGRVGITVSRLAIGLGMNVLALDPYASQAVAATNNVKLVTSLSDLLVASDFLTIHTPLIASTKGMISAAELQIMKKGSRIFNVARGGMIDEESLLEALESGHIAGAGIDVFTTEPPSASSSAAKLIAHPKVIATPHLGASTHEAQNNVSTDVCSQVISILGGDLPRSAVNAPLILPDEYAKLQPFVRLIEKMGSLYTQHYSRPGQGHPQATARTTFDLVYEGALGTVTNTKPLFAALIKGLTSPISSHAENINIVNADLIAKDRGIVVNELHSRDAAPSTYSSLVTLRARRSVPNTPSSHDEEDHIISGYTAQTRIHISRLSRFATSFVPEGHLLICHNYDSPGKIGAVGALLGKEGININFMSVASVDSEAKGDGAKGNEALMILGVDREVVGTVVKRLEGEEGILRLRILQHAVPPTAVLPSAYRHGDPFILFAPVFQSSTLPISFAREGMEVVGTVSGLVAVIASVTAVAKRLNELSTIRAALQAIAEWRSTDQTSSRPSRQLDDDLAVSLNCCAILITVIDSKLGEAGYIPGMKQKIKHIWLEDTLKEYISNLEGQVRALQLLLTIFQCRTVTEQRQKLELEESRTIIENVRAETASLRYENGSLQDAASILSIDPSVNFDVDSILLRSPAYERVYGNRRRVLERPSRALPLPELPPRPLPSPDLASQITPPREHPSQSPPLPSRPSPDRHDVRNYFPVEVREQHKTDLRTSGSVDAVELPAENIIPSTELEAETQERARPCELATAGDSEHLGVAAASEFNVTPAANTMQDSPTRSPLNGVVGPTSEAVGSETTTQKTARPQSTYSDLYNSSIKGLESEAEPGWQVANSTCDARLSKATVSTEPEGKLVEASVSPTPNARSIASPPIPDTDLYSSSIQATSVADSSLAVPGRHDHSTKFSRTTKEEIVDSWPINLEPNSDEAISDRSPIMKDDETLVQNVMHKADSYSANSNPTTFDNPNAKAKSPVTDPPTSHATGERTPKGPPCPTINLDLGLSLSHVEDGSLSFISSNIEDGDFQTNSERPIDNQLVELQSDPREMEVPAIPTRPPPLVPVPSSPVTQHTAPAGPQPKRSVDSTASGLHITGIPSESLPDHASSLYSGVDSDISSNSHQDHQTLRSSPTTISFNTIDTVISTDSPGSLRGQAQTELRNLQLQLAEAKRRGDTHTAKALLQRSIELIQRTYLSESVVREPSTSTDNVNKLGLKKKGLMRLSSFSVLTSPKASALIEAASVGDVPRLRSLLDNKVNVNVRGHNYRTPQMAAAIHGHLDCLKLLKNYPVDEFATDGQGRTVMHVAVMANRLEIVNWLLGAYPPSSPQILKSWRLFRAAHAVKGMISHKLLREVSDAEGSKPLHMAVKLNLEEMVQLLLAAGAQIDCRNNWSHTPLHEAAILDRRGIAQTLMASGAKVEAVDTESISPLHLAAKQNHAGFIALLLANGADRYAYDGNGDLAIHVAARQGNIPAIEALITDRTDLGRTTKHGETLIHIACLTNGLTLADYLVQNSVDVNPWARRQQTQSGLADSVLSSSSNIKRPTDLPQTPLHYSCTAGLYEMSALLLDNGAWANATPDDGMTPLMMAVESENTNLVCLLLARGAKVNATMPGSCLTAMHISARRGDLETTQVLFRDGADMLARNSNFQTPWEYSVSKIKNGEKRNAINEYFRRINAVRIHNSKRNSPSAQAGMQGDQQASTLQGNTSQDTRVIGGYRPYAGPGSSLPPPFVPGLQATYPQPYMDDTNDAFPEAPPAYTPGSSAPRNLVDLAPVHRPASG